MANNLAPQSGAIHGNDGPVSTSTDAVVIETANIDDSDTPRESKDQTRIDSYQPTSNICTSISYREENGNTILTPDTASEAISQNYAHSTILSTASLLSHERNSINLAGQSQSKTKGRKAFEAFSYALDIFVPIDVSVDVTSMSESSIGRIGKAMQEKLRRERAGG